nr:S1 family peptidase [Nocardiopsis mwathae]
MGATALTLGLIASPAAASAEASTDSPDTAPRGGDTQSEALMNDLGLSSLAEAQKLMADEAEARDLEDTVREKAGDAFGGAVFDQDSGKLTVSVTDASAAKGLEALGVETRVVAHGEDALDEVVEELNDAESAASDAVTGWYADLQDDSVVITVLPGETKSAHELIAAADVDADTVRVEESDERPETYANIVGGVAYHFGGRCSVGHAAVDSQGRPGFTTAGHCGRVGTNITLGNGRGVVANSIFPNRDMAFVRATSNLTPTPLVSRYQAGGTVRVTGHREANIGASICRSGSTTGWRCGTIQAKNQTVRYSQGAVHGMTRTNACAEPGDSGGSWVSGDQAQGMTSGGSGNCRTGGVVFYQPLNPTLSQFNLRLFTG